MKRKTATLLISTILAFSGTYVFAQSNEDNWVNSEGLVWKNGDGTLCWRNNYWTPATEHPDCGGAPCGNLETKIPEPSLSPYPDMGHGSGTYSADTFFDFDKSTLKPAGKQILDELLTHLNAPGFTLELVVITGYTDSVGAQAYNMKLSLRRAETVKAYLTEKDIPAEKIHAEGKGQVDPIATNKTREGRAQNRRVEIEVVGSTLY